MTRHIKVAVVSRNAEEERIRIRKLALGAAPLHESSDGGQPVLTGVT